METKTFQILTFILPRRSRGQKGETMTFKITIKELHEAVVDVEAKTYKQAIEQIESDYWENPNDYLPEPKDTTFE